jgi:hypothetical protein
MQAMAKALKADDILPLVAALTPKERVRLVRLIALPQGADAPAYRSVPPSRDEMRRRSLGTQTGGRKWGEAWRDPLVYVSASGQAAAGSGSPEMTSSTV